MCTEKLRIVLKSFIESQFGYCPLIWMFHSRKLNNRINRLHERALRLVYKDPKLTFEILLELDKSFNIHHRNLQRLATEVYKVKHNICPEFMHEVFPTARDAYDFRTEHDLTGHNVRSVYNGTETISFLGPKTWAIIPIEIRNSKSLPKFKARIKKWKPVGCTCRLCKIYIQHLGFLN